MFSWRSDHDGRAPRGGNLADCCYDVGMSLSLLWPEQPISKRSLSEAAFVDLRVDVLVSAISPSQRNRHFTEQILRQPVSDPAIIEYRLATVENLLEQPAMTQAFADVLPALEQLAAQDGIRLPPERKRSILFDVIERIGELELYVECVQGFAGALADETQVWAAGLARLRESVMVTVNEPSFQQMARELPTLRDKVRQAASVTVGVNLDHNLRPIAATLLSVNDEPFAGGKLLDKLLGKNRLHTVSQSELDALAKLTGKREASPLMVPLFADLAKVLDKVARPIAKTLQQFGRGTGLVNLRQEIRFFIDSVQMIEKLRSAGLPMVRPTLLPEDCRETILHESYNIVLALDQLMTLDRPKVVQNHVTMDDFGRIFILTGPNGGGKTTYLQAVGLTHLLAQVGLFVPAQEAEIAPADMIVTHFQSAENFERGTGRFGEEALRLREIFGVISADSLILLNESLASTSAGESHYLAKEMMRLFRKLGARVIFATHLHELAAQIDILNAEAGASQIVSIVASPIGDDPHERTFRVIPTAPLGHSYARELAARHGISYDQLSELLEAQKSFVG